MHRPHRRSEICRGAGAAAAPSSASSAPPRTVDGGTHNAAAATPPHCGVLFNEEGGARAPSHSSSDSRSSSSAVTKQKPQTRARALGNTTAAYGRPEKAVTMLPAGIDAGARAHRPRPLRKATRGCMLRVGATALLSGPRVGVSTASLLCLKQDDSRFRCTSSAGLADQILLRRASI